MTHTPSLPTFHTFGEMLHHLRRSARLSQRELALAVGYSESMISRLEHGERPPDVATIRALFVPALHLEERPEIGVRLIELAQIARTASRYSSDPDAVAKDRWADKCIDEVACLRLFESYAGRAIELGSQVLGPQHRPAMAGLDAEYDNIGAAFAYARRRPDLADRRLQMAAALPYYWRLRARLVEGAAWLHEAMDSLPIVSQRTRALAHVALLIVNGDESLRWNLNLSVMQESMKLFEAAQTLIAPCLQQHEQQAAALLMLTVAGLFDYHGDFVLSEAYAESAWKSFAELGDLRGEQFARVLLVRLAMAQGNLPLVRSRLGETEHFLRENRLAWGLCQAHMLHYTLAALAGDYTGVIRHLTKVTLLGEPEGFADSVHDAFYHLELRDPLVARRLAEAFLERQRRQGPSVMLGLALHQLGRIQLNAQRFDQAEALLDEAVEFWRTSGISYGHGMSLQSSLLDRGNVKRLAGRHEEAIADFSESIALYASASFTRSGIYPLLFRGHARLALGDVTGALADFRQSLAESKQRQVWSKLISITLAAIGEAAYRLGNWEAAGKLLAAAAAAEDKRRAEEAQATTRERATGGQFSEMADYNRIMAQTPAYQRNPVFAAAWQGGKTLSLGDAVELALTWEESPA